MIRWHCQSCGKRLKATEADAGRRGRCTRCGAVQGIASESAGPRHTEVELAGKCISEWLDELDPILATLEIDPASQALATLGPEAVASLVKALRDGDGKHRKKACDALARLAPRELARAAEANPTVDGEARLAVAVLSFVSVLREQVRQLHKLAVGTLRRTDRKTSAVIPALIGALKDESPAVRRAAVRALAELAEFAEAALPALREARRNGDRATRAAADRAVRLIQAAIVKRRKLPDTAEDAVG